jgi:hypothetical protein
MRLENQVFNNESFTIIAGASQCATTAFFDSLLSSGNFIHPKVKELNFWQNVQSEGVCFQTLLKEYKDQYIQNYGGGNYLEASPAYLRYADVVAENISMLPNVKLLFVFRRPELRLNALAKKMANEFPGATKLNFCDFCEVVAGVRSLPDVELEREIKMRADVGFYEKYFTEFVSKVDKDSIRFILFEDLISMSDELRETLADFLLIPSDSLQPTLKQKNRNLPIRNFYFHKVAKFINLRMGKFLASFPVMKRRIERLYYFINGSASSADDVGIQYAKSIYKESYDDFLIKYKELRLF